MGDVDRPLDARIEALAAEAEVMVQGLYADGHTKPGAPLHGVARALEEVVSYARLAATRLAAYRKANRAETAKAVAGGDSTPSIGDNAVAGPPPPQG